MKSISQSGFDNINMMLNDLLDEVAKMKETLLSEVISLEQTLASLNVKRQEQTVKLHLVDGLERHRQKQQIMLKHVAWTANQCLLELLSKPEESQ